MIWLSHSVVPLGAFGLVGGKVNPTSGQSWDPGRAELLRAGTEPAKGTHCHHGARLGSKPTLLQPGDLLFFNSWDGNHQSEGGPCRHRPVTVVLIDIPTTEQTGAEEHGHLLRLITQPLPRIRQIEFRLLLISPKPR